MGGGVGKPFVLFVFYAASVYHFIWFAVFRQFETQGTLSLFSVTLCFTVANVELFL